MVRILRKFKDRYSSALGFKKFFFALAKCSDDSQSARPNKRFIVPINFHFLQLKHDNELPIARSSRLPPWNCDCPHRTNNVQISLRRGAAENFFSSRTATASNCCNRFWCLPNYAPVTRPENFLSLTRYCKRSWEGKKWSKRNFALALWKKQRAGTLIESVDHHYLGGDDL